MTWGITFTRLPSRSKREPSVLEVQPTALTRYEKYRPDRSDFKVNTHTLQTVTRFKHLLSIHLKIQVMYFAILQSSSLSLKLNGKLTVSLRLTHNTLFQMWRGEYLVDGISFSGKGRYFEENYNHIIFSTPWYSIEFTVTNIL